MPSLKQQNRIYIRTDAELCLLHLSQKSIPMELFNVKPVVLHGADVWGSEQCDILKRLQLRFF